MCFSGELSIYFHPAAWRQDGLHDHVGPEARGYLELARLVGYRHFGTMAMRLKYKDSLPEFMNFKLFGKTI